jgi:hypothetical protein
VAKLKAACNGCRKIYWTIDVVKENVKWLEVKNHSGSTYTSQTSQKVQLEL